MRKITKTNIRTETRERIVISEVDSNQITSWCEKCGCEVRWLTFSDAAKIQGFFGEFSLLNDAGTVHLSEMREGHILFCVSSFKTYLNKQQTQNGDGNEKRDI
jgi:hypothetical protein